MIIHKYDQSTSSVVNFPYCILQLPPMPAGMPDIATLTREIMESDPEAMAHLKRYEEAVVRLERAQVGALPALWLEPAYAADTCSCSAITSSTCARCMLSPQAGDMQS